MGWAWKGARKIKKTMRNTHRRAQLEPINLHLKPPQLIKPPQITPNPSRSSKKPSETSVFGNSAASTEWKQSFRVKRESPLPNMMSQTTKTPWNQRVGNSAAST